jgi:succinate dehydrogenase (ubiquinone) cytochrome b560 subunit
LPAANPAAGNLSNAFVAQNLVRATLASRMQSRPVATEKITAADAQSMLAQQRLKRPVSPHLEIYDKNQTWWGGSAWNRLTGSAFAGSLYLFSVSYLAAPLMGWHLESASLAAAVAALPVALKGALKFGIAWPFVFHFFNGTKHLMFDLTIGYKKTQIIKSAWYIWGASIVGAVYLAFFV